MSGILNSITRIIDTALTDAGRNNLAEGDIGITYVSFQDATIYASSLESGSADVVNYPFLEVATSLPSDVITFTSDDDGRLNFVKNKNGTNVQNGKLLASTKKGMSFVTGSISGSTFALSGSKFLESSIDAFSQLMSIGTVGPFDEETEFNLSHEKIHFDITNDNPIAKNGIKKITKEQGESLFQDKRLGHISNFKFLPPVQKNVGGTFTTIGNFSPLNNLKILSPTDIEKEIKIADLKGQSVDIEFTNTSRNNNILSQLFEIREGDIFKLDIIDYGDYQINEFSTKRVFFAGKLFVDMFGTHTFAHIFTLMFFDK